MSSFIFECLYVVIISFIIIHIGYYIYDIYCVSNMKFENDINNKNQIVKENNNTDIKKSELVNIDEEKLKEKNEKKEKDEKKNNSDNVQRNTSLSSMDELNDIKCSLNKMLNDLNKDV